MTSNVPRSGVPPAPQVPALPSAPASLPAPRTEFDWLLYADATFAGLSVLVPVPFVDSAFEWFFRRRMPGAIARRRGVRLDPLVAYEINRGDQGCVEACLALPITLTWSLLKRLSLKLLYFLTVKQAGDQLSFYWHRAFLIDMSLTAGHLADLPSAQLARLAIAHSLRTTRTSPLAQLAQQSVSGTRHVLKSLRRARKGQEDEVIRQKRTLMARAWGGFGDYFAELAGRYHAAYAHFTAARAEAQEASPGIPGGSGAGN